MDIDLLISKNNDVGLVVTGRLPSTVSGAIFDHETRTLSLEFGEIMESMVLNVPVADDFIPRMTHKNHMYLVGTDRQHIHEAYRVPLIHINDYAQDDVGEWS